MNGDTKMPEHFPLMVPGATPDDDLMEVHAPFDRTLIATIERGGASVVEKALDTAYRLFRNRDAWLSAARRTEILRSAAAIMQERREELALEAAREGGKPLMDSLVEVVAAMYDHEPCRPRSPTPLGGSSEHDQETRRVRYRRRARGFRGLEDSQGDMIKQTR